MKKITQLVGIILFISAFNTAQASTYNDLKGSYTLVASSDNSKTCPKGYWIGDAKCDDGLWVQERKTHFTTVICNINGGLQNKSSGGHPHSPIPNPENTSTKNIFDSSKKSLSSFLHSNLHAVPWYPCWHHSPQQLVRI